MHRFLLETVVAGTIGIAAAQTPATRYSSPANKLTGKSVSNLSTDALTPQAFAGTWQGVWRRYSAATHAEKGSQTSLSVTLNVKAAGNGILSSRVSAGDFQHQITAEPNPPVPLGEAPSPVAPPPPPLPAVPPTGELQNPRIEGRTLAFQVKDAKGRLVDFRLTLQGPDAGKLDVTRYSAVYPEFPMKRIQ